MSNEDLAQMIQAGNTDLYTALWENVRGFVVKMAERRMLYVQDPAAVEKDDLIQAGFLGLVAAVRSFDPGGGYSFLSCLKNHLKRAFNVACGVAWERVARDPIHRAISLDAPVNADDPEGDALVDHIRAPGDLAGAVEDSVYREQLRGQLDKLLSRLSPKAADVIRSTFFSGELTEEIAARYGMTAKNLCSSRNGYMTQLRAAARNTPEGAALRRFLDDYTDFYIQIGPDSFARTHTSAPEYLAMKREDLAERFLFGRVKP